jgi:hypothetical protein
MNCLPDYAVFTLVALSATVFAAFLFKSRQLTLTRQELERITEIGHRFNALHQHPAIAGKFTVTMGEYVMIDPVRIQAAYIPNRVKDAFGDFSTDAEWYTVSGYSYRKHHGSTPVAEKGYFVLLRNGELSVQTAEICPVSKISDQEYVRELTAWLRGQQG